MLLFSGDTAEKPTVPFTEHLERLACLRDVVMSGSQRIFASINAGIRKYA